MGNPNKQTAKKTAVALRRRQVAELYLRGCRYQTEIARKLGINRATIAADLRAIREEWKKRAAVAYDEAIDEEIAELDRVAGEAWEGWDRSKLEKQRVRARTKTGGKSGGEASEHEVVRGKQSGDPRFLEIIKDCVFKRCKLRGIDVAKPEQHLHLHAVDWESLYAPPAGGDPVAEAIAAVGGNGQAGAKPEAIDVESTPGDGGGNGTTPMLPGSGSAG